MRIDEEVTAKNRAVIDNEEERLRNLQQEILTHNLAIANLRHDVGTYQLKIDEMEHWIIKKRREIYDLECRVNQIRKEMAEIRGYEDCNAEK